MVRQLAAASLLALSASAAFGADPVIEEAAPAAVDVFSWSGAYVGGHIGYGWGDSGLDSSDPVVAPDDIVAPQAIGLDPDGTIGGDFGFDGVFGGVQAGYNWQVNQFVFGAEADFSFSGSEGGETATFFRETSAEFSTDIDWFGTVRGRAGFAVDRTLIYATGGLAYGQVENTVANPFGPEEFSSDDTEFGWTAGGGVEHAFTDHLTVKVEYLFVDLGDQDVALEGGSVNFDNAFHTVRLGFNYKF